MKSPHSLAEIPVITAFVVAVCLFIASVIGWVMNIVNLVTAHVDMATGTLVVRIIGIPFWPIGAAMGWFG